MSLEDLPARVSSLLDERKRLERELSEAKKKLAMGGGGKSAGGDAIRDVAGIKLLARAVTGIDLKDLRSLADEGKKQVGSGVVAIVGLSDDGKAGIVVGVTEDLTKRFPLSTWCARAPRRSAAKAVAAVPTWRRPAGRTAPRPTRRWPPSRPRSGGLDVFG